MLCVANTGGCSVGCEIAIVAMQHGALELRLLIYNLA